MLEISCEKRNSAQMSLQTSFFTSDTKFDSKINSPNKNNYFINIEHFSNEEVNENIINDLETPEYSLDEKDGHMKKLNELFSYLKQVLRVQ